MLQGRLFSYPDTHRHRLGANYDQIPINCPYRAKVFNGIRDGPMRVDRNGGKFIFIKAHYPTMNLTHSTKVESTLSHSTLIIKCHPTKSLDWLLDTNLTILTATSVNLELYSERSSAILWEQEPLKILLDPWKVSQEILRKELSKTFTKQTLSMDKALLRHADSQQLNQDFDLHEIRNKATEFIRIIIYIV